MMIAIEMVLKWFYGREMDVYWYLAANQIYIYTFSEYRVLTTSDVIRSFTIFKVLL